MHAHPVSRSLVLAATVAVTLCTSATAGTYYAVASCDGTGLISVAWSYLENPQYPSGHPEWVGYDVLRRSQPECGPFERVNASMYPRTLGADESFLYTEQAAQNGKIYEYRVIMVDANRQELSLGFPECDFCVKSAWVSCPEQSTWVTQGTLEDWGWTLFIQPCGAACYPAGYLEGQWPEELRAYAGTSTVFRFYGQMGCGSVEGCYLLLSSYEPTTCVTGAARPTWGGLKLLYR